MAWVEAHGAECEQGREQGPAANARARGGLRVICIAMAVLMPASSGQAQRRPHDAKQEERATSQNPAYRAAIEEAVHEFELGNWNEALALFQKAHSIEPNARTLRGIGFCLFENRRYVDAMRHLEQAMVDTRSPLMQSQRGSTQQVLERAAAFVGHVTIQLSPSDARLSIDGKETQLTASGAVLLDPGEHELAASAPGYTAHALRVQVESGQNAPFKLELTPAAPEPAAVARAPIAPAEEASVAARDDRERLKRGLMIGGFSLAGVGLVTGAVTGILTLMGKNKLEKRCPDHNCPSDQADTLNGAQTQALVSSISFAAAAVGAGLGLTGVLLPPGDKQTARGRRVEIALSPSSLTLSGSF